MLRGNPSKKPIDQLLGDLRPEIDIPDCPTWTWPEAKKEWKRISIELERYGLISRLDRSALVLYVQAWAKMVWAEKALSRAMKIAEDERISAESRGEKYVGGDGIMVLTANGNMTYSHYWVVGRRSAEDVSRYLTQFGLSPSSRSRVVTSDNRQIGLFEQAGQDSWNAL